MTQRSSSCGDRAVWVSKINSSAHHATRVASSLLQRWASSFSLRPATPACELSQHVSSFENLEDRRLFSSVTLTKGILKLVGDADAPNKISADVNPNWTMITGKVNGVEKTYRLNQVFDIQFIGGKESDRIWIDPQLTRDVYVHGGGGEDVLSGRKTGILPVPGMASSNDNGGEPAPTTPQPPAGAPANDSNSGDDDEGSVVTDEPWSGEDNTGEAGAPRPIIETIGQTGMAGHTVHVNAVQTVLNGGTPIDAKYEWDFGDPGSEYNRLTGFNAAHHYTKPGTYTVTLRVTNASGKTATTKTTVQISPDTRKAIYVDAQGSDSNDGSSPSSAVRTLGRAEALVDDNSKVLLQRGDTFSLSDGFVIENDNVTVSAYGSGSNPVVKWNGPRTYKQMVQASSYTSNVVVENLTFDSVYTDTSLMGLPAAMSPRGTNFTGRSNTLLNVDFGFNNNGKPRGVLALDNSAPSTTGLREYFAWVEGTDHVYLGNDVANSTRQHVIRAANGYKRVLIADNDFSNISRGGADIAKPTLSMFDGEYIYAVGNRLNDGPSGFGPLGSADAIRQHDNYRELRTRYGVFEDNIVTDTTLNVSHGAEHIAVRNNRFEHDNDAAITIQGYNSTFARGVVDLRISRNTGINNGTKGQFLWLLGSAKEVSLTNNLYVAPNMETGSHQAAVIYVSGSGLGSFKEIRDNVWADPNKHWWAEGGIMYVYSYWSNQDGYRTPSEWDAMGANGDRFFDASPEDAAKINAGAIL